MHVSVRKRVRNICLRVKEAEWRQDRTTACLCVWQEMRVQTKDMGTLFPSQKQIKALWVMWLTEQVRVERWKGHKDEACAISRSLNMKHALIWCFYEFNSLRILNIFVQVQFMFFELFKLINVYKRVMSLVWYEQKCPSSHLQLHPDSDPSNPGLHSQFVQLNEAYRVLSREGSRRDYDLRLRYQYTAGPTFRSSSSTNRPRWLLAPLLTNLMLLNGILLN